MSLQAVEEQQEKSSPAWVRGKASIGLNQQPGWHHTLLAQTELSAPGSAFQQADKGS